MHRLFDLFDLGTDIGTIEEHLARDPALAPLVARHPGLRAPGGWDGFELAVRAILGQQVSVAAARRAALEALSQAALADPSLFHPFGSLDEAIARLRSIRGVGEWTAQYIALRALRARRDRGIWRKRMGIEPTLRAASDPEQRF